MPRAFVSALAFACAVAPLPAQSTAATRSYGVLLSGGPSDAFRSVDTEGWHAAAALVRPLNQRLAARLELTGHTYGAVPVYPCLIQDSERCYQTLDRKVVAGIANLSYEPMRARESGLYRSLYLIGGVGVYDSRREATAYPDCELPGVCGDRSTHTMTIRDTQLGLNGGIGANLRVGPSQSAFFVELRVHYARRSTPAGRPSNDYFLTPVSVGFRL